MQATTNGEELLPELAVCPANICNHDMQGVCGFALPFIDTYPSTLHPKFRGSSLLNKKNTSMWRLLPVDALVISECIQTQGLCKLATKGVDVVLHTIRTM